MLDTGNQNSNQNVTALFDAAIRFDDPITGLQLLRDTVAGWNEEIDAEMAAYDERCVAFQQSEVKCPNERAYLATENERLNQRQENFRANHGIIKQCDQRINALS